VQFLCRQPGVNVNVGDGKDQGTPLHSATLAVIAHGDAAVGGDTPADEGGVVAQGHEGCVAELLAHGSSVNAKVNHTDCPATYGWLRPSLVPQDAHQNTAGHYASVLNFPSILRMLCKNGADCGLLGNGESLAALNMAAGNGYEEVVTLLLENGADVNAGEGRKGGTPVRRLGMSQAWLCPMSLGGDSVSCSFTMQSRMGARTSRRRCLRRGRTPTPRTRAASGPCTSPRLSAITASSASWWVIRYYGYKLPDIA
jgi:hypothetical protein